MNRQEVNTHRTAQSQPVNQCVLREVNGIAQYVPLADVPPALRVAGERLFVGTFSNHMEKAGPYGSDRRVICTPVRVTESSLVLN